MVHKRLLINLTILLVFVTAASLYANDVSFLSFGTGKTKVRLYTNYFCGPCRDLEPKIEGIIIDLVKRNIIDLTFIDTPPNRDSVFYARYFLFVLNEKKELSNILTARTVLFEAARGKIVEKEKLEEFLRKKGIKFKPFDARPVFNVLSGYLREDKINSTPTCVIYSGDKKETFTGATNIAKALENLRGISQLSGG
jgi:thiol-disulfide isomerase/thioredoxin